MKDRKKVKIIYDDRAIVKNNNINFKKIPVDTHFLYLGADFTPSGLCKIDPSSINSKIDILLKAPAKPQQKLYMFKNFLLPSFYHSFIFSKL